MSHISGQLCIGTLHRDLSTIICLILTIYHTQYDWNCGFIFKPTNAICKRGGAGLHTNVFDVTTNKWEMMGS